MIKFNILADRRVITLYIAKVPPYHQVLYFTALKYRDWSAEALQYVKAVKPIEMPGLRHFTALKCRQISQML